MTLTTMHYWWRARYHRLRRGLAALRRELGGRSTTYGHDGTIHQSKFLDIEVDPAGNVVAVWFRCSMLPFRKVAVDWDRARSMTSVSELPALEAVVLRRP